MLAPESPSMQPAAPDPIANLSVALEPVFLRMPMVMRITGLGRSTIYRLVADRQFPTPVKLGRRAIAWRRSDLDRWSQTRPEVAH